MKDLYQAGSAEETEFFELIRNFKNPEVIKIFQKERSLMHLKGWLNVTALHISVEADNFEMVKYLIRHRVDINARTTNGDTPLYWSRNPEITKFLFEKGARLDNHKLDTPMSETLMDNYPGIVKVLRELNATEGQSKIVDRSVLDANSTGSLQFFIAHDADLNVSDSFGNTLHHIAKKDNVPLMELAMSLGIKWTRNEFGQTPYHYALSFERDKMVEFFDTHYPELKGEDIVLSEEELKEASSFGKFIVDGNTLISRSSGAILVKWEIKEDELIPLHGIQLNLSSIYGLAHRKGDDFFVFAGKPGTLECRSIKTLELIKIIELPTDEQLYEVAYSTSGKFLFVSESWDDIYVLNDTLDFLRAEETVGYISGFHFDCRDEFVGINCSDQFIYDWIYRLDANGKLIEIDGVDDIETEEYEDSHGMIFSPYESAFLISITKDMFPPKYKKVMFYELTGDKPSLIWELEVPEMKFVIPLFAGPQRFMINNGPKLELRNLRTRELIFDYTLENSSSMEYLEEDNKVIVSTSEGFKVLKLPE